ncbi:cation:proton antiporter [Microbispora sp. NPDC049125]|uniref:cation:proton antiporter n=1 Tax=Microbispora sp. NPDC049125 TaxID=3154929 RepID=UPI003467CD13
MTVLAAAASAESAATGTLAALTVVILAAACFSRAASRLRQPIVIGEIAAGIALGPSLLGLLPGDISATLFPPQVVAILASISQLAIACYMFCVGYETDLGELRARPRGVFAVAAAATAVPLAGGFGVGLLLQRLLGPESDPMLPVFTGILLSVTAVPVLTRILDERGLRRTPAGTVSLGAAAVCDIAAWLLLALATSVGGRGHSGFAPLATCALLAGFTVVMFTVGRRLLGEALARARTLPGMALLMAILLGSTWFSSWIGLHAVFGALLCGVAAPRRPGGAPDTAVLARLHGVGGLLLPAFFVVAGLGVHLDGGDSTMWLLLLLVTAVAVTVKLVPAAVAARLTGLDRRQSLVVGALMNTRGLTELIAIQVAYAAGVIDGRLYTVFVLMALVTTAATGPMLDALRARSAPAASRPSLREEFATAGARPHAVGDY